MTDRLVQSNMRLAQCRWPQQLGRPARELLRILTDEYGFSIANGDLVWLGRGWYVTHTGLIRLARRSRCTGIHTRLISGFCDPQTQRWAVEATVYKTRTCRGFVGSETLTLSMSLLLSKVPRCALPRHEPSTGLSARRTASASAQSRKSDPSTDNLRPVQIRRSSHNRPMATATEVAPSAIDFAKSSASTTSIPIW